MLDILFIKSDVGIHFIFNPFIFGIEPRFVEMHSGAWMCVSGLCFSSHVGIPTQGIFVTRWVLHGLPVLVCFEVSMSWNIKPGRIKIKSGDSSF